MPLPDEPPRVVGALARTLSWAILALAGVATVAVFVAVDSHSHSVSDTFYGMVVPEAIALAVAAGAWLMVHAPSRARR